MAVLDYDGDGKINIEDFANGFIKTKLFNVEKKRHSMIAAQTKQEPDDFFLSCIKKKGFCSGYDANRMVKKSWASFRPEMNSNQLSEKIRTHLINYSRSVSEQQQPFSIYLI